jgi:hypothetical protein
MVYQTVAEKDHSKAERKAHKTVGMSVAGMGGGMVARKVE